MLGELIQELIEISGITYEEYITINIITILFASIFSITLLYLIWKKNRRIN